MNEQFTLVFVDRFMKASSFFDETELTQYITKYDYAPNRQSSVTQFKEGLRIIH